MNQHIKVELIPLTVPADVDEFEKRRDAVERLGNLDIINPESGTIPDTTQRGWIARINGAEFPVTVYGIEPSEHGEKALVSLLVPADAVQIDAPRAAEAPRADQASGTASTGTAAWGAPGISLAEQVALNAQARS